MRIPLFPALLGLITLLFSTLTSAVQVEAVGRALVVDGDIKTARQVAIEDASRNASMQVYLTIQSGQSVEEGELTRDYLNTESAATIESYQVLEEQLSNNTLRVRILAEVTPENSCLNGADKKHLKRSLAITAFPLERPTDANLGGLHNIQSKLASLLAHGLRNTPKMRPLSMGTLNLHPNAAAATTGYAGNGNLTDTLSHLQDLGVQFAVSGVIRDMQLADDSLLTEQNLFLDSLNRLDPLSKKHLRNFALDLFIHDARSGRLIMQKQYYIAGQWDLDIHTRTGFATPAFWEQKYGQQLLKLLGGIERDISHALQCAPLSATITASEGQRLWIDAGQSNGLKSGDRFKVVRKQITYRDPEPALVSGIQTDLTLTIDQVDANSASGVLSDNAQSQNIQREDWVVAQ